MTYEEDGAIYFFPRNHVILITGKKEHAQSMKVKIEDIKLVGIYIVISLGDIIQVFN